MLRTIHVVQVWQEVSVFGSSCVMSLLSLPRSPRHFPTTLSSPPAPTSPPSSSSTSVARSRCQSTSAPARWRESGRLADSSPQTRMVRDPGAQGNLLRIHKLSIHAKGFSKMCKRNWRSPIDATFSVESYKTNVLTWRLLWHRRGKLPHTLGRMLWRIRKSTWIRNSRMSRVSLILLKKLVQEQSGEILNVECLRYSSPSWERWILANDQAIKWAKTRVFVYADSVLCLGRTEQGSGAAEKWKGKFEDIKMYSPYQDAVGIDGEAIELEWKIPDFSILSILQEIQEDLIQKNVQPKEPNHLRVNGQRHLVEIRWSELHHKRRECEGLRVAVPSRTLDVSWSRLRHDMVRRFSRTTGTVGSHRK